MIRPISVRHNDIMPQGWSATGQPGDKRAIRTLSMNSASRKLPKQERKEFHRGRRMNSIFPLLVSIVPVILSPLNVILQTANAEVRPG